MSVVSKVKESRSLKERVTRRGRLSGWSWRCQKQELSEEMNDSRVS